MRCFCPIRGRGGRRHFKRMIVTSASCSVYSGGSMANSPNFLAELRRRKVARAALVYTAAAFAALEFADIAFPRIGLPDRAVDMVLWLGLLGLPVVLGFAWHFDWYPNGRRVVYTRNQLDDSGRIEMMATDLQTGEEVLLLEANASELSVAPDGLSVAFNSAEGHFSMSRYLLRLSPNADGSPRPLGGPEQITFGRGVWHAHGGAWTPEAGTSFTPGISTAGICS